MEPIELSVKVTAESEEVLYSGEGITRLNWRDIDVLKSIAWRNRRKRVRLCAHRDIADPVQEMLIVHLKQTYVRPHKHLGKNESYHMIEGRAKMVVFDEWGGILNSVTVGAYNSHEAFFYRSSGDKYHTILCLSDYVVFHETTRGPYRRAETLWAQWSPDEMDYGAGIKYMEDLAGRLGENAWGLPAIDDACSS